MRTMPARHYIFWTLTTLLVSGVRAAPDSLLLQEEYRQAVSRYEAGVNVPSVIRWANRALTKLEDTPVSSTGPLQVRILNLLGEHALETGEYDRGIAHFSRSEELLARLAGPNGELAADTYHKTGNFHRELKNVEKAEKYFRKALELRLQIYGAEHLKVADTYNNIGDCRFRLGDYDKALEYHEQVLRVRLDQLPEDHPDIAKSYCNLALCWEKKNRIQFAKADYEKALKIYLQSPLNPGQQVDVGHLHLNLGNIFDALYFQAIDQTEEALAEQHYQASLDHYRQALRIYRGSLPAGHPSIALCYNNLANAQAKHNRYNAQANRLHRQALQIRIDHYGPVHADVAEIHYNMAQGYISAGALEPTLEQFHACLAALNYRPEQDTTFQRINNYGLLIKTFSVLGTIYQSLFSATLDSTHLHSAFGYYLEADRLFDFLRKNYETTGSQLQLAQTSFQIYEAAIQTAYDLYRLSSDRKFLNHCFRLSEKSKGLLLLTAIKRNDPEAFAGIPSLRLTEVKMLEGEIAELEKKRFLEETRSGKTDLHAVDSIASLIFNRKQALSQRIDSLEFSYPQYYDLIYATEPLTIQQIQEELLGPGQTMIEYFPGIDAAYIFVINREDFVMKRVTLPADFPLLIYSFSSSIHKFSYVSSNAIADNVRFYQESAQQLYQILIEPVRDLIGEELIIIPGGELETLPFDALLTSAPAPKAAFNEYPFLIKEFAISYNYSASLLHEMRSRTAAAAAEPYLGIAPEFLPDDPNGLTALHYNENEIRHIGRLMRGDVLLKSKATKNGFLEKQRRYRILHLATHGLANSSESNFSYLAFRSAASDLVPEDALLYVKEIYNMSTNAEMVVLSACQTGVGQLQKGEGIASIARSFSYAGARSLLATQWSVDDKTTSQLMELFFRHIKRGMSKDKALRAAKLEFINQSNRRDAHPYFWAAFVPIGDMAPVRFATPALGFWMLIPLLLLGYLGFFWIRVRQMDRLLLPTLRPEYSSV